MLTGGPIHLTAIATGPNGRAVKVQLARPDYDENEVTQAKEQAKRIFQSAYLDPPETVTGFAVDTESK